MLPHARASTLSVEGDEVELPLRPRMLKVVAENLASNAVRYAGPGARCTLSIRRHDDAAVLLVSDDGVGVSRTIFRACSSASTAPTARALPAEPVSGSRS